MNNSEGQTQEPVGGMKSPQKFLETFEGFDFDEAFTDHELEQITNAMSAYHKYATQPPAPIKTEGEDEDLKMKVMRILVKHESLATRTVGQGCNYESYILPRDYKEVVDKIIKLTAPPSPVGIELVDIPAPIGNFIIDQKDIAGTMGSDGMYYHYSQVCVLLNRLKASLPQSSTEEEKEPDFEFTEWAGKTYIRLQDVWVHRFNDQRNQENWINTDELYNRYKSIK